MRRVSPRPAVLRHQRGPRQMGRPFPETLGSARTTHPALASGIVWSFARRVPHRRVRVRRFGPCCRGWRRTSWERKRHRPATAGFFPSPPRQGFSSAWLGGTACRSLAGRCHTSRRTHSGDVSPGSAQSVSMVGWRAATVRACVSRSAASTNRSSTSAKRERDNECPTATTTRECATTSVYAYLQRQARNTTQGI